MILSSLAKILKESNLNSECILIIPEHPRIKDDKMSSYYKYYNKVIKLSYNSIFPGLSVIIKNIVNANKFQKELSQLNIEINSELFMLDVFKFQDLQIMNFFQRKNIPINVITAFAGKQFNKSKLQLMLAPTITFCLYSLIFGGMYILTFSRRKNTNLTGYYRLHAKVTNIFAIRNAIPILISDNVFLNMPYPIVFFGNDELGKNINPILNGKGKILLLVSTLLSNRLKNYWQNIKSILGQIDFDRYSVFIKDHPGVVSNANEALKEFSVNYIDSKINAEQIYLNTDTCLDIVIGYGSTSLVTASWLGQNAFDYTRLLDYSPEVQEYYDDFLALGTNIVRIKSIDEIKDNFESLPKKVELDYAEEKRIWIEAFKKSKIL